MPSETPRRYEQTATSPQANAVWPGNGCTSRTVLSDQDCYPAVQWRHLQTGVQTRTDSLVKHATETRVVWLRKIQNDLVQICANDMHMTLVIAVDLISQSSCYPRFQQVTHPTAPDPVTIVTMRSWTTLARDTTALRLNIVCATRGTSAIRKNSQSSLALVGGGSSTNDLWEMIMEVHWANPSA